jgi:hypothetical protein
MIQAVSACACQPGSVMEAARTSVRMWPGVAHTAGQTGGNVDVAVGEVVAVAGQAEGGGQVGRSDDHQRGT